MDRLFVQSRVLKNGWISLKLKNSRRIFTGIFEEAKYVIIWPKYDGKLKITNAEMKKWQQSNLPLYYIKLPKSDINPLQKST